MLTLATVNLHGTDVLILKDEGPISGTIEFIPVIAPDAPWTPEAYTAARGIADVWKASRMTPPAPQKITGGQIEAHAFPQTPFEMLYQPGTPGSSRSQVAPFTPAPHPCTPRTPLRARIAEIMFQPLHRGWWVFAAILYVASHALLVFAAIGGRP
ncbi:hypothetical protein [Mesoterricola sediminis]|uniref:Uncharacterized protein n=1 Tax=Mesoterricola sediminis TaxID=2927980 RepID=A0AA48GXM2_9BACT|nr:hypothetical protein [Mesoterricola sediminis]BDU76275.1 hypothetical protein METESE_12330 [Mesoterricola sediminis]